MSEEKPSPEAHPHPLTERQAYNLMTDTVAVTIEEVGGKRSVAVLRRWPPHHQEYIMDRPSLEELKQKLLHEKALPPVWAFFLDHFGENPDFIARGERADHPFVEAVIAQVSQQLFPKDGAIGGLILTRVAESQFIHGGFFMGLRPGGVIYFEDARIGLLAVADIPPSIEAKYARFSGHPVPKLGEPSRN
jgi:hypothetical protein